MEQLLKEILAKLNVLMSNTYVSESDTLMDIYNNLQIKYNEELAKRAEPTEDQLQEVVDYARRTGNYKIEGSSIVVEYKEGLYHIPQRRLNG